MEASETEAVQPYEQEIAVVALNGDKGQKRKSWKSHWDKRFLVSGEKSFHFWTAAAAIFVDEAKFEVGRKKTFLLLFPSFIHVRRLTLLRKTLPRKAIKRQISPLRASRYRLSRRRPRKRGGKKEKKFLSRWVFSLPIPRSAVVSAYRVRKSRPAGDIVARSDIVCS